MAYVIYIKNPSKETLAEIRKEFPGKVIVEQIEFDYKKITIDSDRWWQPK